MMKSLLNTFYYMRHSDQYLSQKITGQGAKFFQYASFLNCNKCRNLLCKVKTANAKDFEY